MANTTLFSSIKSLLPRTDSYNEAGGRAYKLTPRHALAQIAATGCFNGTFYASGESQLDELRKLIGQVDDNVFLAKLALYARERAYMKDMPAALLVVLSKRDTELMHRVFDRIVDNGRVLRTVFQMIRSGQFGRTSLSSSLQRAFQRWLNEASVGKLLSASIGNDPSLRDILRMARPTPKDNERRALFGWLTDKEIDKWAPASESDLPVLVQSLIAFRKAESAEMQALILGDLSVRWDLLADAAKGPLVWKAIARRWEILRLPYNLLMGLTGGLAVVGYLSFTGPSTSVVIDILLYAIAANVLYLLGPITEMYLNWLVDVGERSFIPTFVAQLVRSRVPTVLLFLGGTIFSVLLTLAVEIVTRFMGVWFVQAIQ